MLNRFYSSDDHFAVMGKSQNIRLFFIASERDSLLFESEQYNSWHGAFFIQEIFLGLAENLKHGKAVQFEFSLKECTLALIPLLSNYVLHDDRDLFCVAPRGNILAFSSLSFT
ncbi:hypothetical protein T03_17761 [Trichinella britovi]|uniref:Uncharacterized protein n=1 Tax=Trichinella britovi TaxID=45882 RepID=A0A0V1D9Q3_TRIBR|nr:hypothetical protein T03_17761 [Trichinella britovi]